MKFDRLLQVLSLVPVEFNGWSENNDLHDLVCYETATIIDCIDTFLEIEDISQEEYDYICNLVENKEYFCVDFKGEDIITKNNDEFIKSLKEQAKGFNLAIEIPDIGTFSSLHLVNFKDLRRDKNLSKEDKIANNMILVSFFRSFFEPR